MLCNAGNSHSESDGESDGDGKAGGGGKEGGGDGEWKPVARKPKPPVVVPGATPLIPSRTPKYSIPNRYVS